MARTIPMTEGSDPDPANAADSALETNIGRETQGVPAAVLVGAIALLVVLVSLPRFRAHVLRANQEDARLTLDLLGQTVFAEGWLDGFDPGKAPEELFDVVLSEDRLLHRFQDARRVEGAPQMLHHGYLVDTGNVLAGGLRRPALVTWPSTYGKSGDTAFARTRDGSMYAHRNGGLWTGPAHPLIHADLSDEGWKLVRRPSAMAASAKN